ncbi:helix-turn-helix transcriptional regulator [Mycolicibacterium sp.]|uniref:helix-turn-helix transcriptional regulator n=1 Tax=Mycolicibacterium sp. TaxID=2320850 RepID=UPI0037C65DAF
MTTPTNSTLMTLSEFASEAGIPLETVRYWRRVGYGPRYARIGKRVMVLRDEAQQWIREQFDAAD